MMLVKEIMGWQKFIPSEESTTSFTRQLEGYKKEACNGARIFFPFSTIKIIGA